MEKIASKLGVISFNLNKIIFRGKFMRKIDCAHRKILKKFSGGQKMEKIVSKLGVVSFTPTKSFLGVILCEESIIEKF